MLTLKPIFTLILSLNLAIGYCSNIFQIHGKISNSTHKVIVIKNNYFETVDSIVLDQNNNFDVTLNLESNYNFFCYGSNQLRLYLKPNCNLQIDFDALEYPNSFTFIGDGAAENRYMKDKLNFVTNKLDIMYYTYYATLEESDFIKYNIDLMNEQLDLLESAQDLSKEFSEIERISIKIDTYIKFANYRNRRRMILNDNSFDVSDEYVNPYREISLNNSSLLNTYNYREYVHQYVDSESLTIFNSNPSLDFFILYLEELGKDKYDQPIKDRLAFDVAKIALAHSSKVDEFYNLFQDIVENEKYKSIIREEYSTLKVKIGAPSENFLFTNIHGDSYSLADFKGNYLYIDIWATWCRPCIKEIPHLKKLENEFGNKVSFVSIAFNDNKENWQNMISAKDMPGVQLFAADENDEFFKFYDVQAYGLPRFILLDKEGNIIDSRTKNPSSPILRKILSEL